MKKNLLVACSLISIIIFSGFLGFGSKKDVVAEVGREKITLESFNERLNSFPKDQVNDDVKKALLDDMIAEQLLIVEAKKEGIQRTDDFKNQLDIIKNRLLSQTLLQQNVFDKISVSDEDIRNFYESNFQIFDKKEQREVKHVLFDNESQAKKARNSLMRGKASFTAIVNKYTKDAQSKPNGGNIGYITKGQLAELPVFENTVFSLTKKRNTSKVIKSKLGWHIIRLVDVRTTPVQTLEQSAPAIRRQLENNQRNELLTSYLDNLKETISVESYPDMILSNGSSSETAPEK